MNKTNYDAMRKYDVQIADAKRRGIAWQLTFDEWWKIWMQSGHWNDRGRNRGDFVMARIGHAGPYRVGNVRIVTQERNTSDKQWSAETRARMRACINRHRDKLIAARWPREQRASQ
jgi:hypothetical protein